MIDSRSTILLTGATGLVGRYLMRDLLRAGNSLVVLARGRGAISGYDRVEAILQDCEQKLGQRLLRPVVLESNICEPGLGINASDYQSYLIGQCDRVIHCAASLRFEEDAEGMEPLRTNVEGTRHVVEFAQESRIPHFHHVSTAYVCGNRKGVIREPELDCGQSFHNIYEQTKFQAEQLVTLAKDFETKTIYRPSIIIGDSGNGFSSTFHTVYSILRFLRALPDVQAKNLDWILKRLELVGGEGKNIVPIDWVSQILAKLVQNRKVWGKTFHLTHSHPTNVQQLSDAIADAIDREWTSWEAMALPASIVDSQVAYQNHIDVYRGYLADDPQFDTNELQKAVDDYVPPRMDHERLVTILAYAIKHRFRDTTQPIPRTIVEKYHQLGLDSASLGLAMQSSENQEKDNCPPMGTAWRLNLSGPGGGVWNFDSMQQDTESASLPWVHTTAQLWEKMIQGEVQLDYAISTVQLVIGGPKELRGILKSQLSVFIEWCRHFDPNHLSNDNLEMPTVVPMIKKFGGRRHA
jgi:thioester reductase-like protein